MASPAPATGYQQLALICAGFTAQTPFDCQIVNGNAANDLLTMRKKRSFEAQKPFCAQGMKTKLTLNQRVNRSF
jgi:hypothetical protein